MKKTIFLLLLLVCGTASMAQTKARYTDRDYQKKPLWIAMMDDPNANFFEVERAYELYWTRHEKPEGEHEDIGERAEREKTPGKRKQRKISAENDMRLAVKKYEVWNDQTRPYVQPDGRILSVEERLRIWKEQQQNNQ